MNQKTFISVVIPLYNKELYISRAIKSVLSQKYENYEIIIINDGSTDKSVEVVNTFKTEKLRYYEIPNSGVSFARNYGVSLSNGEWVSFLDADDEYLPNYLESIANFIYANKNETISFIGTGYQRSFPQKKTLNILPIEEGIYQFYNLFRNLKSPSNSSCTAVYKESYYNVGGFSEVMKYNEDWMLWFKLSAIGRYGYIPKVLSNIHINELSTSKNINYNIYYNSVSYLISQVYDIFCENIADLDLRKNALNCLNEYTADTSLILLKKFKFAKGIKLLIKLMNIQVLRIFVKKLHLFILSVILRKLKIY